jgi:hypothetical protein
MSYSSLAGLCQLKNGAPFSSSAQPVVKTVLLSNYGGVGYGPSHNPFDEKTNYQCDGRTTFKTAYSVQMNPYASAMCKSQQVN